MTLAADIDDALTQYRKGHINDALMTRIVHLLFSARAALESHTAPVAPDPQTVTIRADLRKLISDIGAD